ncbi:hypothetical protein [Streptomyces sp. NRRL S-15]|uniref:hypothetical protein n=1 Tax=Streptomyces sp. NRRL S-15 TaxID=1463886 RepID=UPI0004CB2930|nr:hypothetical protein [Streptomyces sp. NRRL S-15]
MAKKNVHVTGDHTGDIGGTVISGNSSGTVVTSGNVYQNTTVQSGGEKKDRPKNRPGVTVIKGDHHGDIGRTF